MLRRSLVLVAAAAFSASATADLAACGDKFLRAGRSARSSGYAAIHRANILIYKPSGTAKGLKEFESILKRAGHKAVALQDGAQLSSALASAKYDVIIADYADAPLVSGQFDGAMSQPGILPILHKPTADQEAQVRKSYHCIIKPESMTKYDALAQIDHVMELRLKGAPPATAR